MTETSTVKRPPSPSLVHHRAISGRLVIATHNPGKLAEMRELLAPYGIDAISAGDMGLSEPDETGSTFRDNARIKAEAAAQATGLPAFADDSGLVVETLNGAPGIHSARWAGPDKNFRKAMETIEDRLREHGATSPAERRAHFVSALCVGWPDRHLEEFEGRIDGTLVWPPRGNKGFGYDPMFLPDGYTRTFGEMTSEEKHGLAPLARNPAEWTPVSRPDCAPNQQIGTGLSHRARAFLKLAEACFSFPPPHAGEDGAPSAPGGGKS